MTDKEPVRDRHVTYWQELGEADIANKVEKAMAEQDRMKAACKCDWDERSYFWNPACPEHTCPDGADDENWERWFKSHQEDRERKAWEKCVRIRVLFDGLEKIYNVIKSRSLNSVVNYRDYDMANASGVYQVLFKARDQIQDEIQKIAREV